MKTISLIFLLMLMAFSSQATATEIKEVHWGTEMWEGFTDKDGSGIYTQIFTKIFNDAGLELKVAYMPFARTLHLVEIGKLDFAGGIPKEEKKDNTYIQAEYPVVISRFDAFFNKDSVEKWKGLESIKGRKIVATPTVSGHIGLKSDEVYVVDTRKQALQMVLSQRAEFYVDDAKVLETTLENNRDLIDMDLYRIENVTTKGWYMIAPNNERGRKIMQIYETGTERLHHSGELKKIYDRHGFLTPSIGR